MRVFGGALCILLAGHGLVAQQAFELRAGDGPRFRIVPAELRVELVAGESVAVLAAATPDLGEVEALSAEGDAAGWRLPAAGLTVAMHAERERLDVRIRRDEPGDLAWPTVPFAACEGLALPWAEGVWVGAGDEALMAVLRDAGEMRVTEELTLPFLGLCFADRTVVCAMPEPYYHTLEFPAGEPARARITHRFTKNRPDAVDEVVFAVAAGAGPGAAALEYRRMLEERGELVTFAQRVARNPRVDLLRGAPHCYVWGNAVFSRHALGPKAWCAFAARLVDGARAGDAFCGSLWGRLTEDARDALEQMRGAERAYRYLQDTAARGIAGALRGDHDREALSRTFADLLQPREQWGDGASIVLLDAMHDAGIDRAVVLTADLDDVRQRPDVVAHARELGFLFGPYDSYHSIHDPATPADATWRTAQFDGDLWQTGRIVGLDGEPSRGFQKKGFHLSPIAARPAVERRVDTRMTAAPYGAWFVDCDGFGQFFDDANPAHPATRLDDAAARRARLRWLSTAHRLVVGSEGATAVMASAIDFAHGVLTPVFGWGDPALHDRDSEYWLGGYWPPEEPGVFFRAVPACPNYRRPWFDPRDRLPLFQIALGDSVVATHHWSAGSLKFAGETGTRELLELLYVVPPLYHLNRDRWAEDRDQIVRHYQFFSPLHRALAACPMTGFAWRTDDRLVQRTTFATPDGEVFVTANFDAVEREKLPPRSITVSGALELAAPVYTVTD